MLYTAYTQKNGAVSIYISIETAPLFYVYSVYCVQLLYIYVVIIPTTAQYFFLLLHVSANHRSHHQGVTFHRRVQRAVSQ
jgi:hypothetical protein